MSQGAAGDFVKSLKEKISRTKDKIKSKRNLLQDSLNLILDCFTKDSQVEVRSVRDFEINELATYFDMYIQDDVEATISRILEAGGISYQKLSLDDYKFVFVVDLENKLLVSGNPHNLISLEIISKKLKTYKFRVTVCDRGLCYSVHNWGYHQINFWYVYQGLLNKESLSIRGADRSKKKAKFQDFSSDLEAVVKFNDSGQTESLDLLPKKRKKNSESLYNT